MPRSCSDAFYFHLVYEYLVHMGMDSTSRRMLEECDIYGYPIPYLSENGVSMQEINRLLDYFDDENCPEFFKEFEMAVPVNIQNTTDCRKLKLGLHVYFAVTGLRFEKDVPAAGGGGAGGMSTSDRRARDPGDGSVVAESTGKKICTPSCPCKNPHCMCRSDGGSIEEKACIKSGRYGKDGKPDSSRQLAHPCMTTLLAFLEKDGSELSKEPELLPYFALPFILEPEAHPHYEHLFKPPWASNLRRWLWNFLISHRQASRVPELVLLLPDLHSALAGRTARGISVIGPSQQISCPSSDHEICMNHVTSNMHGKTRLRQYRPKDPNAKPIDMKETTSHKAVEEERSEEVGNLNKKPVTFHQSKQLSERDDKEGTAGCHIRCTRSCSNDGGSERVIELEEICDQSCLLYGNLRSRYNQLHSDYHNLLGVAAELTDALENCVRGEQIDLKKTLENCALLFPEILKTQAEFNESDERVNAEQKAKPTEKRESLPKPETVPLSREVVIVPTESPQHRVPSRTVEVETQNTPYPTTKSSVHQNKTQFSNARPTKPNLESNSFNSESPNLFCTSMMIPLNLMPDNDNAKMYILCDLNFKAIKRDLYKGSIKRMILLLQALRWRLTRTGIEQRTTAIESYISSDLFCIRPNSEGLSFMDLKTVRISETTSLLVRLLMPCGLKSPHPLQQASSRLINAIASIRDGRHYLVISPSVVEVHARTLYEAELDPISLEMIIATLQKLSLRSSQRQLMIQANLVEWLADQLSKNVNNRSVYWLKYTAALFMNLCLHAEARERCVPFAGRILESIVEWIKATMVEVPASSLSPPAAVLLPYIQNSERKLHTMPHVLMVHISPKALPYLNGIMYSLLSHPEINQKAVEMRLAKTLEELIVLQEDKEAQCQLRHILSFHREQLLADPPSASLGMNQDIEDGKWVLDLLEDELDAADPVQAGPEDLTGEQLLCTHYSLQSMDSNDVPQQDVGVPIIDLEECQLPVRPQVPFTTEIPYLDTSPRSSSRRSLEPPEYTTTLSRPSTSQDEHHTVKPYTEQRQSPNHDLLQRSVLGCYGQSDKPHVLPEASSPNHENTKPPTVLSHTPPTTLNINSPRTSRNSDALPTFSTTAVILAPSQPRIPTALPDTKTGHSPRRTSIALPEITAEWPRTATASPETSTSQQSSSPQDIALPGTSLLRSVDSVLKPAVSSPRTRGSIALAEKAPTHDKPPTATPQASPPSTGPCLTTESAAPESAPTSLGTVDTGVGSHSEKSDVSVTYTKQEHIVRCRTPENIEVIVAVTLSPDKQCEGERSEHIIRTFKKIVKAVKSSGKELQGSPSKNRHSQHHNDKEDEADVTAAPVSANTPDIPSITSVVTGSRTPKVCGIWEASDFESDSLDEIPESSQHVRDGDIAKDSIFSSRPRIPRTPPNNPPRSSSKTNNPQSPTRSKHTHTPQSSSR